MLNQEHKILILAATQMEMNPLIQVYLPESMVLNTLYRCRIGRCTLDFLVTGVGLMSSAFSMGKYMNEGTYDFMLQLGIAGSLTNQLDVGDVVCVQSDVVADEGVLRDQQWLNLHDMGLGYKKHESSCMRCVYVSDLNFFGSEAWKLIKNKVNGISVNTITTDSIKVKEYTDRFGAQIETMEGASYFYAAIEQQNVPFLAIRSISNAVGADRSEWNIPLAVDRVSNVALKILKHFTQNCQ